MTLTHALEYDIYRFDDILERHVYIFDLQSGADIGDDDAYRFSESRYKKQSTFQISLKQQIAC